MINTMTSYVMLIIDWSSVVCSSDLERNDRRGQAPAALEAPGLQQPHQGAELQHLRRVLRRLQGRAPALHRVHRRRVQRRPADPDPYRRRRDHRRQHRSEEHTSELQSLMRISYAVFCLKKKKTIINTKQIIQP